MHVVWLYLKSKKRPSLPARNTPHYRAKNLLSENARMDCPKSQWNLEESKSGCHQQSIWQQNSVRRDKDTHYTGIKGIINQNVIYYIYAWNFVRQILLKIDKLDQIHTLKVDSNIPQWSIQISLFFSLSLPPTISLSLSLSLPPPHTSAKKLQE